MWVAFVFFLPDSLLLAPLILLVGFSISWLICLMWVWPPVDRQFKIGESLRNRNKMDDQFDSWSSD
jgi:hypothetical protein